MKHDELKKKAMDIQNVKAEYEALEPEFTFLRAMLSARQKAGLTQADIAERMGTKPPAITRLESSLTSGKHSPSLATLKKYAKALGYHLEIRLVQNQYFEEDLFQIQLTKNYKWVGITSASRSSRQGYIPTGESPVMSFARFRHVAMPQFIWVTTCPMRGVNGLTAWKTQCFCGRSKQEVQQVWEPEHNGMTAAPKYVPC